MWRVALRDLQWRRRRFVIAVLATSLVFGMTLLMAGADASLHNEGRRIVAALGADAWLVADGASGPFTTSTPIPAADAERVAATPGVVRADPLVVLHSTLRRPSVRDVNVIGARPDGLGAPRLAEGHPVRGSGEVVADTALGLRLGDRVELSGLDLQVVGLAEGVTWYFGTPTVFLAIQDTQALGFKGQPLAMTIITQGVPRSAPSGLQVLSDRQAQADLERPLASGTQSIAFINALLWLVAAGIIGSIVYLSALERQREFAVLKATGDGLRVPMTRVSISPPDQAPPTLLAFDGRDDLPATLRLTPLAARDGYVATVAVIAPATTTTVTVTEHDATALL